MKSSVMNLFKKKKFLKFLAIGVGFSLTATTIVLPTTFYATAQNLLYLDSLGNVKDSRATNTTRNEYIGEFTPGNSYKTGDIVSVKEARFHNPDLLDQFATTNNQIMYRFNQDWTGDDISKAPVSKYVPNNLTTISIPLSQFVVDDAKIDSFMGYSNVISGIGKSSITGKFTGSGAAYGSETRPGYISVDNENYAIKLSDLDAFFTWTKNQGSIIEWPQFSNPIFAKASPTLNDYPEIGENPESQKRDRYGYDRAGMYAIQLGNEVEQNNDINIVDSWYSSINSSNYTQYSDMLEANVVNFDPTFTRLSRDKNKTFFLDDDNLGVYIYSKSSNFPLASRYATMKFITNATFTGFYQGVAEPIYAPEGSPNDYRYLTRGPSKDTSNISVSYPGEGGAPTKTEYQVGFQSSYGAYVYAKSTTAPNADPNTYLNDKLTRFDVEPLNPDRDISYINGIFSINKPKQFLDKEEQQQIRWYVPIASTDYSYSINEEKVNEYNSKLLASDAMNLGNLADMYTPYLYNAIPSTFYGAQLTVTADNTNGTIWVNLKSGPTVEVTNGSLMKKQQVPGSFVDIPNWLVGMNWTYYKPGQNAQETYSRYWYRNESNPVSEVLIGEPIDHTIAITGFQKISPTKIVHTTNPKGDEFIQGVSIADETEYGPYRLTGAAFTNKTPFDYIKEEEAKMPEERYADLMQRIYDDLVYNKGPTFNNPNTSKPFITQENLLKISDVTAYNFIDQNHPEWGGRIQFSVTLNAYFSEEGLYVENGGFPSVPVMFSGFKAVPGPTTITTNYNLNSMIPGGAVEFNRQNLGTSNGINYPSDYLDPSSLPEGQNDVYKRLEDFVSKWSNRDPFIGDGAADKNEAFTSDFFMIKNLPEVTEDGNKAFSISESDVEFNNFAGILKITPKFKRYYNLQGDLIEGVNTSLGTITISGFQTVDGSTYIPPVVQAISSGLQPSAVVTGSQNVDATGNYIGQELYKIAWNESINLPTKNYDLPPYGTSSLSPEQFEEIKRVIDIKIKPDDSQWVDNRNGFLKFAVAFKRIFNSQGIPEQIDSKKLWPSDWDIDKPNDHIFFVTVYGYNSSPGPTGILQQPSESGESVNRNIIVNQPNFQPSEFIKNDSAAGFPLLRSLIQGNLINLPSDFDSQDIVLSVDDFNANNDVTWDPNGEGQPLPLVPNNADGSIKVQVYLKKWYNSNSKLCNLTDDNQGFPYTYISEENENLSWSFTISGFMKTNAKGESDLSVNDNELLPLLTTPNTIDLSNPNVYNILNKKYPSIAKLRDMLPYQFATPTTLLEILNTKNVSQTSKTQPYLLMKNIPENIKPFNMFIKRENISVNNIEGSVTFKLTLKQWFTIDKMTNEVIYHPTLEDQSNGILEFTTPNSITITGLKKVKNATIIKPNGDTVNNNGEITITKNSTSEQIINGILLEKWLNKNPDNINNLPSYVPFIASENQPTVLDETDLKVYVYVALYESGGSPHTLEKGSMVEKTEHGSYRVNDLDALNEFISWKINPSYDLETGSVEIYPMLNTWFGGADAQIYNQYQSFGAGDLGKPQVSNGVVTPATITTVKLSGFIHATAALSFNDAYVFNGQAIIQYLDSGAESIALSKFTANDFVKNPLFMDSVKNIVTTENAIVSIVNQPGDTDFSINNLIDFNDPNWYKVNELNGTIEIKTKELKYFDGNKELQVGRISLVLSGFKPSVSAYQTTYIILVITIVALIVVLAIVLSRILWVKYNNSRNNYKK